MSVDEGIYLDYAAATPVGEQVLEAMLPYFSQDFANPSASYAPARQVHASVEDARARIAHLIGGKPANISLHGGATEANNLALIGRRAWCARYRKRHRTCEHAQLRVSAREWLVRAR